ncbi:MAG: hypothetical protein M1538_03630 [Candidatus Marsarchaeota archaeon]|nr:hypothetical protein [Candidatus Marsarchaeota archaeon]
MKIQSAFEFLITYSWAILIISIMIGLLYYFMNLPNTSSQNLCSMESTFLCKTTAFTNYTTNTAFINLNFTNNQDYPIENAFVIVGLNGKNLTQTSCAPILVETGNTLNCSVNTEMNIAPSTVISGKIFLSFGDCALVPNYVSTKNCNNAPIDIVEGQFFTHAS